MDRDQPLVIASSASLDERRFLEILLKSAGYEVRGVACASEANGELSAHDGRCVLVIDSGLLEMSHDGQWRLLRATNPDLGTVVRCWIDRDPGIKQTETRTFFVHPDHTEGLIDAVRILGVAAGVD